MIYRFIFFKCVWFIHDTTKCYSILLFPSLSVALRSSHAYTISLIFLSWVFIFFVLAPGAPIELLMCKIVYCSSWSIIIHFKYQTNLYKNNNNNRLNGGKCFQKSIDKKRKQKRNENKKQFPLNDGTCWLVQEHTTTAWTDRIDLKEQIARKEINGNLFSLYHSNEFHPKKNYSLKLCWGFLWDVVKRQKETHTKPKRRPGVVLKKKRKSKSLCWWAICCDDLQFNWTVCFVCFSLLLRFGACAAVALIAICHPKNRACWKLINLADEQHNTRYYSNMKIKKEKKNRFDETVLNVRFQMLPLNLCNLTETDNRLEIQWSKTALLNSIFITLIFIGNKFIPHIIGR